MLVKAGIGALAVIGGAAALATPASAATRTDVTAAHLYRTVTTVAPGGTVRFNGTVTHNGGVHITNLPTQLQEWTRIGWRTIQTKRLNKAGWVSYWVKPDQTRNFRLYFPTWTRKGYRLGSSASAGTSVIMVRRASVTVQTVSYSTTGSKVVAEAMRYRGRPYAFGAAGPYRFDCSGFTQYIYRKFGVSLPHRAASQRFAGRAVSRAQARPGDLVVFSQGGTWGHVGIYVGNGYMIDAPHSGATVRVEKIWTSAVVYRRLVG